MKPKIGIIICGFSENRQFVSNEYIQAVRYSNGLPFILPLVRSDSLLEDYVRYFDGFLFCGGSDITPLLFGEGPLNGTGRSDITVDLFQLRLMKQILRSKKPLLGICRGMQILNVACGGNIWQDLSLCPGKTMDHMQKTESRSQISHLIRTDKRSRLNQYIGSRLFVNSFHHQAVRTPGSNIKICALAGDDTVEAIELTSHPFALGVQWHPECMFRSCPEMRRLFRELVSHSVNRTLSSC